MALEIFKARYVSTGVHKFKGNPFIETLGRLPEKKSYYLTNLAHYPEKPTAADRRQGELVRFMNLSVLADIIVPFPEFERAGCAIADMVRECYVSRNPLSATDHQRRHALALGGKDGLPLPSNWKSTAQGYLILSISGMGKTTFVKASCLRYPQLISHKSYQGTRLTCTQITHIYIRAPHDGTMKSLCLSFFEEIDRLIGSEYAKRARARNHVAQMVQLMREVANAVSLGLLIIDEFQNLRYARSGHAEIVLNMLSEIIEQLGISILILATPALQPVVEKNVRNTRKITSDGQIIIPPMEFKSTLWAEFCDTYWEYMFLKKHAPLTKDIRKAWYAASAGDTAFAVLALMQAQRDEIGYGEEITADSFFKVSKTSMAFLQPAISALMSKDPNRLILFDDLLFGKKYQEMRRLLGAEENIPTNKIEEFEDVQVEDKPQKERSTSGKSRQKSTVIPIRPEIHLPVEDPQIA